MTMRKWWGTLTQTNKISLIAVVVGTLLTAILSALFSSPAGNYVSEDGVIQKNHRGINVNNSSSVHVSTGDTYHIGITLKQYEQGLKLRETEVRESLKKVHAKGRQQLMIELQTIQTKLQNSSINYEELITSLKQRIAQLERLQDQIPNNILTLAINALAQGNSQQADQLFKQIEKQNESTIKIVAESAFQRCLIAKDEIHYQKALKHCEKAVRLVPNNSIYLNQTGLISKTLADFKKAIEYFELALANDLNNYSKDHPSIAIDRNNLGFAWVSLGQHKKAIEYFELALVSNLKFFGKDHYIVAAQHNNLGDAWRSLGHYKKAIKYHELALTSNLKIFGENSPHVARDRSNLGLAWKRLGHYQKAIKYYDKALASDLKTFGEEHPSVAVTRNNLGGAWHSLGLHKKAIEYFELALSSDLNNFGEDHPKIAIRHNNLGSAWNSLGHYQKAIEYYELALASDLKRYDKDHIDIAIDRNNLGRAWGSLGQIQKAIDYYELALASFVKKMGENHSGTKRIRANLEGARNKLLKNENQGKQHLTTTKPL